jgi:AmmeMemoRadiSam system protein B
MGNIRSPAVAGAFYPANAADLAAAVDRYVADAAATPKALQGRLPKALIAPHAGYVYSGPIAGSAYACLRSQADTIRRVVLLGPAHRVPLRGLAASSADVFATPLGDIPIDRASIQAICRLPQVRVNDQAHHLEHSLEVQLPFLQRTLVHFELIPLAVGDATSEEVAEVLDCLWNGATTFIVVSSDLSHYYDYATAARLDRQTALAIEDLAGEAIASWSACGHVPIRGLLRAAANHGLHATTLDLRNSGDTAGGRDEVVGYGAYAFA